jgi:DNA-binding NarL/FixJ family response regulator
MPAIDHTSSSSLNQSSVAEVIDNITDSLERVMAGFITLKSLLLPEAKAETADFDPKDPANKYEIGGLMKLTPRGIEICYRLFDAGKSRYAVATLMGISFGAATHRLDAWKKLGGVERIKQLLE